jgi:hypothetical protein
MDITIACPCGEKFTRNEGSAGVRWKCSCGRDLQVPTLAELRRMSGEPEDPERRIRGGIDKSELFPDRACCRCEARTDAWVPVMIECEPGNFDAGGFDWKTLLFTIGLTLFLFPVGIGYILLRSRGPNAGSYGKGYRVPLLICAACQKRLDKGGLVECLRQVPVYDRLLDKYPEAKVSVIAQQE